MQTNPRKPNNSSNKSKRKQVMTEKERQERREDNLRIHDRIDKIDSKFDAKFEALLKTIADLGGEMKALMANMSKGPGFSEACQMHKKEMEKLEAMVGALAERVTANERTWIRVSGFWGGVSFVGGIVGSIVMAIGIALFRNFIGK